MPKVKAPSFQKPASMKAWGKAERTAPVPKLAEAPQRIASVGDDTLRTLTEQLGDEQLAKRVLKLRAKFYAVTSGTIPELIVMDYLDRHHYSYEFQKWLLGGRAKLGGQVVDFAVDVGVQVLVIEVQGSYFHNLPGRVKGDNAERLALLGIEIWGKPVKLVEVWDTRLVTPNKAKRQQALQMATSGVELGI